MHCLFAPLQQELLNLQQTNLNYNAFEYICNKRQDRVFADGGDVSGGSTDSVVHIEADCGRIDNGALPEVNCTFCTVCCNDETNQCLTNNNT